MRASLLLLAVVAACPASGADPTPVPPRLPSIQPAPRKDVTPRQGDPVQLARGEYECLLLADYTGPVTWDVTEPSGGTPPVDWFELKAGSEVIGTRAGALQTGRYTPPAGVPAVAVFEHGTGRAVVSAWGVRDGRPVKLAQILVDANHGPQPPPVDPIPVPPKPFPVDPLTQSFQIAYDSDKDVDKAAKLATLAELMGSVVAAAKQSGKVNNTKQLQDAVHQATDLAVGVNKIPETRKAVGAYLSTKLPTTPIQPMTDALWATAATEYANVAASLRKVKP